VFLNKVGAGRFAAWLITANILMALVIDKFGMFGMDQHPLSLWRMLGSARCVSLKFSALPPLRISAHAARAPRWKVRSPHQRKALNLKMGLGRPLMRLFVSSYMGSAH
jgi:hypothetical protein